MDLHLEKDMLGQMSCQSVTDICFALPLHSFTSFSLWIIASICPNYKLCHTHTNLFKIRINMIKSIKALINGQQKLPVRLRKTYVRKYILLTTDCKLQCQIYWGCFVNHLNILLPALRLFIFFLIWQPQLNYPAKRYKEKT